MPPEEKREERPDFNGPGPSKAGRRMLTIQYRERRGTISTKKKERGDS